MLIECVVRRDEPINVSIGNEKYAFDLDDEGRPVARVWIEDHIAMFLSVDYLYQPLPGEVIPVAVLKNLRKSTPSYANYTPVSTQQIINEDHSNRLVAVDSVVMPLVADMKRLDLMSELRDAGQKFDITSKNETLRSAVELLRCAE